MESLRGVRVRGGWTEFFGWGVREVDADDVPRVFGKELLFARRVENVVGRRDQRGLIARRCVVQGVEGVDGGHGICNPISDILLIGFTGGSSDDRCEGGYEPSVIRLAMPTPSLPRALVIRTAGTNCDMEMCRAFEMAGASVELVHVDRMIAEPARIDSFDLIGFPGGFSYGDDIASGRILAMKLREKLYPALRDAAKRGCPMIGACNGFQVLTEAGLLPGVLLRNRSLQFICKTVDLVVVNSASVLT